MTPSIGPGSCPLSFSASWTFFTFSLPPPVRPPELFWLLMSEEPMSELELVLFSLFFFADESLLFEVSDDVPLEVPMSPFACAQA